MQNRRKNKNDWHFFAALTLALLVQLVLIARPAQALTYWTDKDGAANFFNWENGGSDKGLFGDPILVGGDTFVFFPSNFRAESINGKAASKSDRLEVGLLAHPGYTISAIQITEYGDYGILDQGKVSVSGTMFVTNLNVYDVRWDNLKSTPPSPILSGQGNWSAKVGVTDIDWTHLKIVLNDNLMAISCLGSTAFIEKKVVGDAVAIRIIPEPATICLLGLGTLSLIRRKNNNK